MTSVNSPACLLACNNFYRNFPTGPESCGSGFSCQDQDRQRQVQLCIPMATPTGFPPDMSRSVLVDIVLTSAHALQFFSLSKPGNPSDRGIK